MLYYAYDPQTKVYLGEGDAAEDQLEPGVFHLPFAATWEQPMIAQTGYDLVWGDNGHWSYQIKPVVDDPEPDAPTNSVNKERDARIAGGFVFQNHMYQTGQDDRENIAGASTAALAAIVGGAQVGNYKWGSSTDFGWIAADNTIVKMDAQTVFAFGSAALAWKSANIFAAYAIKARIAAGETIDYTDDQYWPELEPTNA